MRWGINVALGLGLLGFVLWRANPWELADQFDDFSGLPAAAAVALNIPVLLVLTLRGQYILRRLGHPVAFVPLLPISILGNVAGSLTPASAGDLLRTPFFRSRHEIPYRDGLTAVLYERGYSFLILAVSTAVAGAWTGLGWGVALAISGAGLILVLAAPRGGAAALGRLRHDAATAPPQGGQPRGLRARIMDALDPLIGLLSGDRLTLFTAMTSLAVFGLMTAQMWCIGRALDLSLGPEESWLALGSSLMAGIATLLPLGIGSLDATLAALVSSTDEGFEAGAAAAVLLRLTITLPLSVLALASYGYLVGSGSAKRRAGQGEHEGRTSVSTVE